MNNELKDITREIKYRTGKTLEQIAGEIGYARAYFTNQVNKGTNNTLRELLIEKYLSGSEQIVRSEAFSKPESDHDKYVRSLEENSKTLRDAILLSLNAIQASQADLRKYAMENDNRTLEILRGVANIERHLGTGIPVSAAAGMHSVLNEPESGHSYKGKGGSTRGKGGKSS